MCHDEMVSEIAGRLNLNNVQVEKMLAFYSMLRRKPMGKHHVQVCTNVACMLRGGTELLAARGKSDWKLGTRNHAGRRFLP